MKKTLLYIAAIVVALSVAIPSIVYAVQFSSGGLSQRNSDWGSFASFLSVFVGAGVGVANLLLVIYITKIVGKKDDQSALNEVFFKLNDELSSTLNKFDFSDFKEDDYFELIQYFNSFTFKNNYLFESYDFHIDLYCIRLKDSIYSIGKNVKKCGLIPENSKAKQVIYLSNFDSSRLTNPEIYAKYPEEILDEISLDLITFQHLSQNLLNFIRCILMDKKIEVPVYNSDKILNELNAKKKSIKMYLEIKAFMQN